MIEDIDKKIAELMEQRKKLTLMQGVGVEEGQDGNVGAASAITGEQDYSNADDMLKSKKKMFVKKMQGME